MLGKQGSVNYKCYAHVKVVCEGTFLKLFTQLESNNLHTFADVFLGMHRLRFTSPRRSRSRNQRYETRNTGYCYGTEFSTLTKQQFSAVRGRCVYNMSRKDGAERVSSVFFSFVYSATRLDSSAKHVFYSNQCPFDIYARFNRISELATCFLFPL